MTDKTITTAPEQPWGRDGLMAMAAVRYCLGRSTYIVSDCCDWLLQVWTSLPDSTRAVIKGDIEDAISSDDRDRAEGREHKTLGHDCDRNEWKLVRRLWTEGRR